MLRKGLRHSKKVTEEERADRETITGEEARTPHNIISKEQKTKVSQKPTDRTRWRMKERHDSCCRISVVTFSDY